MPNDKKQSADSKKVADTHQCHVDIMDEESEDIITLTDDMGNDVEFYQVACVEYDHEFYALLQPVEQIDGISDDEAVIFKIEEEDEENDLFLPVEDQDLLKAVFDEYIKAVADQEQVAQDTQA